MSRKFMLLAGVSTALIATPAFAQDAAPAEADAGGLEEIIVTAQKREQNLQNVPVSVTALGAEAIANQRISDFSDITRAAASLTVTQTSSSPNNAIILRGIGTFAFSIGVEPSVSVIIDDMAVVQQAQAFDNLNDIQRIEVLKGPQGTLFGKNASAGVINIVTKDPTKEFSGNIQASAATDGDQRIEGSISAPIGDSAGFRLTGFYHNYDGNIRDLTNGAKLNDQENYGVRGKLKFNASDDLTFTLTGAYAKSTQKGTGTTIRQIIGTAAPLVLGAVPLLPSLTGITPGTNNYNARLDALGATTNKTASVSGKINYDLGSANLISVTSYQDWKYNFQNDVDGTDINVLSVFTRGAVNGGIAQSGPYHSTDFSQELRLVSSGSGPLKYVFGGYYADAKTTRAFSRGSVVALANWYGETTSKSTALFAQLDYTLPTNTTISGGVRYNHEKIGVLFNNLLTPSAAVAANPALLNAGCFIANNPSCNGTHSDNVVTWKGSISQELAPKILAYASVARGYKGFAFDVSSGFNPARINGALAGLVPGTTTSIAGVGPVKAESSTSYELGLKSRFFDNRVQLNLTGFYTNYNNFQAQSATLLGNPPVFSSVLNNVGKLRTKGVEVELSAKPTEWLQLDSSAAYTDAVIKAFPIATNYLGQLGTDPACIVVAASGLCSVQNRSGGRLPNSPKFKFAVGATANFPISDSTKGLFIVNYQHQSAVNFDLLGNPLVVQKAYGVLNSSIGAEVGRFKITAFVNNIFNTHYAASVTDTFNGSTTSQAHVLYQFLTRDSQRYAGVKVGVSF
jgi:iron complex outermembrane recepter protein